MPHHPVVIVAPVTLFDLVESIDLIVPVDLVDLVALFDSYSHPCLHQKQKAPTHF